jgi:hypothetical protein
VLELVEDDDAPPEDDVPVLEEALVVELDALDALDVLDVLLDDDEVPPPAPVCFALPPQAARARAAARRVTL